MSRVNRGRHVIIENETHAKLKEMCNEAGVLLTTICDTALRFFMVDLKKMTATDRNKLLQEIVAGTAFANAFAGFAELIKLADEHGTIVDMTREGEGSVAPPKTEGPAQGGPQP